MAGTPRRAATCAQSKIAVTCGTPVPATTRVVQIEPGPMPILIASAPASISASAASAVAMLPAMTSTGHRALIRRTISTTPREWPCEESTTRTSTSSSASAAARSSSSGPTPTAAPTRSRPCESFVASGYWIRFWMSLTVISPLSCPAPSTTGSFSILWRCSNSLASSSVVPTGTVTRFVLVIRLAIGCCVSSSKRRSRLVRIPTSLPAPSVIGTPEMW